MTAAKKKLTSLPPGPDPPRVINVVIETPKGSKSKYEYSEATDTIHLDRVLHSSVMYPLAYGFIPGTRYLDGDPLDVMVLMSEPVFPGCLVTGRTLGVLRMVDSGEPDDKILAACTCDPRVSELRSYEDLSKHELLEIAEFFRNYKRLEENRVTEVKGWDGKEEAYKLIRESMRRYAARARAGRRP